MGRCTYQCSQKTEREKKRERDRETRTRMREGEEQGEGDRDREKEEKGWRDAEEKQIWEERMNTNERECISVLPH